MSEDKVYRDGDIVWVKLGNNWWPGEVTGRTRHPEGLIKHLKRVPYCVVKFFNESTYEYVRSSKQIFPFQCSKQEEFIRKGYSLYNSGNSFMEKFPSDVEVAKELTSRKETSLIINDRPGSIVKAVLGQALISTYDEYCDASKYHEKRCSVDPVTKILNITQSRNNDTLSCENPRTETSTTTTNLTNDKHKNIANSPSNNSSNYQCNICGFSSVRLNVMILHRKMHSNRNSLGSNSSTSSKATAAKSTAVGARTTKTSSVDIDRNQIQQNNITNKGKNIIKTKTSTITTTSVRPARTSSPLKEKTSAIPPVEPRSTEFDVTETAVIPLTPKEKNNRITKAQTPINKSKIAKKIAVKEKKKESAYDRILSDFSSIERETSPPAEENQSRRSLRHCKNTPENTTGKVSTICIDLSETKTIQKIPKKREYISLQLQHEIPAHAMTPVVETEHDVIYLANKEKDSTTTTSKKDVEDIRRMLLADWSDDDETPTDAIVVDDNIVVENAESNVCRFVPGSELHIPDAVVITSTPIIKPSSASIGRIRNIPKKDRRDVVLQDFNSDLSLIHSENAEHAAKTVAVDFDSSNSSIVEIIEDQPSAAIITINDYEDQDSSKSRKNQTDVISTESKDNDKSASASTSTTTLSCFDFQDDEDEPDNTTTTIPHFKKKYLSGDKLHALSSTIADDLSDDNFTKSRAELAEKDQLLTAEIETLLQQTQPTVAELLNANSFEESMSVKDLPIKERGKRIFKSRNKIRMEDNKTNTELAAVTTVQTVELYKSNANTTAATEGLDNDNDRSKTEPEVSTDKELEMIPNKENLINKKCLIEMSSQEILFSQHPTIPKVLEDKQLTPNEYKKNEDLSGTNIDCSEVSISDKYTSEDQKEKMENAQVVTSDGTDKNIDNKTSLENITREQQNNEYNGDASKQLLNDDEVTVYQQRESVETNHEQERLVRIEQSQEADEKEPPELESISTENIEVGNEGSLIVETTTGIILDIEGNNSSDDFPAGASEVGDVEKEDVAANTVKVLQIKIFAHAQENFENDLTKERIKETAVPEAPEEMSSRSPYKELKTFTPETSDDNGKTEILSRSVDKELKAFTPEKADDGKKENQKQCSETIFKIRVKSPEQLLDQAFVIVSQQEHEQGLPTSVDSNIDTRLITTTPTDENSSMGASDTGAEFGSPTSMLSEERLPTFRFQSNQTPQQEIETGGTELRLENAPEKHQEATDQIGGASSQINENFLKFKLQIYKDWSQKSLQQRRFSMNFKSLQTEPISFKRQRLSVDGITSNQEDNFEKPQENLLTNSRIKSPENIRSKSRHMKITPRRNVSALIKEHPSFENNVAKDVRKNCSLEGVEETQSTNDIVSTIEKEQLRNTDPINGNCNRVSEGILEEGIETIHQVEPNNKETFNNTVMSEITENEELENPTDTEKLIIEAEENQENFVKEKLVTDTTVAEKEEVPNVVEPETKKGDSPTKETTTDRSNLQGTPNNTEEKQKNELKSKSFDDNSTYESNELVAMEDKSAPKSFSIDSTNERIARNLNRAENIDTDHPESPIITVNRIEEPANNTSTPNITLSFDSCKMHKDQLLQTPFSPEIPPPTPQEREVVIQSENLNQPINIQPETQTNIEEKSDMTTFSLTSNDQENSKEIANQPLSPKEKEHCLSEIDNQPVTPKEEEVICTLAKEPISDSNTRSDTPTNAKIISECETLAETSIAPHPIDMIIEFDNNVATPSTPKENDINDEYESGTQIPSTPQAKDCIIECEPLTPLGIIECDHNMPAQLTREKEVVIESDVIITATTQDKDIIIEENLQLGEKDTLLEREFQVIEPKEDSAPVDMPHESQPNTLQTDADKAAEEFLIEFDSIVNHSHTVEEDMQSGTVEDAVNAEDLINNIIEEVHEDHQLKKNEPEKSESPFPYESLTTYKVAANKSSFNQIFKDSFNRQLPAAKRRQTICFEISDTKEGVACKKQAFDFESILPVNKTIKRTTERKLTLPAIETKLSNSSQPHNILTLNHNQLTLNKKLIPTAKRKLSIEDNITSFIIERPKQQQSAASEPPPLQRIRPLSRQAHIISKAIMDSFSESAPPQSNDNLLNEFLPSESAFPTQSMDIAKKSEGGMIIHQQIISSPTISSTLQNKTTDTKITMNKQIGVDSRGNKYVIIKTPASDIVVHPTLSSSTSAAVAATNNYGSTMTIQPLARSNTDVSATTTTTKNTNLSSCSTTSSRNHQLKHISITVPAKSPQEILNSSEMSAKTQSRNRRKSAQAKAVAAATAANTNMNSAKHRQAMEALSRRLSIASEAPPSSKMSRTSSTQISNNNNITTFFGDTQISNVAQQQLLQLQQQHTQTIASPLPPPIILNKNAHQQSAIQRKTRKISQQQQKQVQHQQLIAAAKSSQIQQHQQIQIQQQQHNRQQRQAMQQQFITQVASQQEQPKQRNSSKPPPLQQIEQLPMQQQIVQQSDGIIITTAATEDDNVIDSNTQLIALPTQPYPGYSETFLLCKVKGNTCKPVDNVPLYLNTQLNELVPVPLEAIESGHKPLDHQIEIKASNAHQHQLIEDQSNESQDNEANLQIANINCNLVESEISGGIESEHQMHQQTQQQIMEECVVEENDGSASSNQITDFTANQEVNTELVSNNGILLNIEGQQVLLDAATFAHLLANPDANTQLISDDGTEYVLTHEVLAALQMQQEQQQALELASVAADQQQQQLEQAGGTDIIAVALAGSDLYDSDVLTIDTSQGMQLIGGDGSIVFPAQTGAITQQHLTPPAVVTNAVLDQSPIMSTLEVPSSIATAHKLQGTQLVTVPSHHLATSCNAALGIGGRANLEDSLAAIGVTTQTSSIPTSLGLPITVTNPNIASKVTSAGPLNEMLQFVSHRPATAAATAAAVAAAALAGESRIFTD